MVYQDMWLTCNYYDLQFYDMKDGSLVKQFNITPVSISNRAFQLSDGRIAVVDVTACRVISFFDSEVSRRIKVEVLSADGIVEVNRLVVPFLSSSNFSQ